MKQYVECLVCINIIIYIKSGILCIYEFLLYTCTNAIYMIIYDDDVVLMFISALFFVHTFICIAMYIPTA